MQRFALRAVISVFIGLLSVRVFAQDGVKLSYKFTSGELMRYQFVNSACCTSSVTPTITITLRGILRMRVIDTRSNGDAEIRVALESGTAEFAGNTKDLSAADITPMILIVSPDGVIRNADALRANRSSTRICGNDTFFVTRDDLFDPAIAILSIPTPADAAKVGTPWGHPAVGPYHIAVKAELLDVNAKLGKLTLPLLKVSTDSRNYDSDAPADGNEHTRCDAKAYFDAGKGCPADLKSTEISDCTSITPGLSDPVQVFTVTTNIHIVAISTDGIK